MNDLRFSCPYCGQHVQCDLSHAGENIPCPSCAQLIRVPQKGEVVPVKDPATNNPFAADESKVSYTKTGEPAAEKVPTLDEALERQSSSPDGHAPVTEREQQIAAARLAYHEADLSSETTAFVYPLGRSGPATRRKRVRPE